MSDLLNKLHEGEALPLAPFLSAPFNDSRFNHLTSPTGQSDSIRPLNVFMKVRPKFSHGWNTDSNAGGKHCAAMFSARVSAGGRRSKSDASARLTQRRWYAARTAQRTVLYLAGPNRGESE